MTIKERMTCRGCGRALPKENVLDLGNQEIVDFLAEGEEGRGKAPLQLVNCDNCHLLQLRHTVDADTLYRKFWYRSSINESMRAALQNVVEEIKMFVGLKDGDVVGDIGSNDSELLTNYPEDVVRIGFEPAKQIAEEAQARLPKSIVVNEYFSASDALKASGGKKYKAISAVAMFYDLDHPHRLLSDVHTVLADDGVFVIQMNYLMTMLRNLAWDNISHEHLCYYSLTSLKNLLDENGFKILGVSQNEVNGGSIRVVMTKGDGMAYASDVQEVLDQEESLLLSAPYTHFGERVKSTAKQIKDFLISLKKANKVVYAYGASTRGLVLLQTILGDTPATDLLAGVAERDPNKIGKKMAGIDLPIVDEQEAREKADYMLVLPYHFWHSIKEREKVWMLTGGKFILPVPYAKVVSYKELTGSTDLFPVAVDLKEELEKVL